MLEDVNPERERELQCELFLSSSFPREMKEMQFEEETPARPEDTPCRGYNFTNSRANQTGLGQRDREGLLKWRGGKFRGAT